MIRDLIERNRSYRRFHQSVSIDISTLRELVDLARLSASGANLQPLKYVLSCDPQQNEAIFAHLAWAGYLLDWLGPAEGERPAAYIVILGDKNISSSFGCDHGIAAQSILLGAVDRELGGCMLGSINRKGLTKTLGLDDHLEVLLVVALGKPAEKIVLEDLAPEGSIKYYRDDQGVHHVPKRSLEEIII